MGFHYILSTIELNLLLQPKIDLNIHRLFQGHSDGTTDFVSSLTSHSSLVLTVHIPHTHKDLFLLMPQKILSQPRTWGTRFDSFIASEASPTLPQPTETNNAPDVLAAEHVPDDPPKPTDQRMPHDASIFVGRYFIVTSSLRFFFTENNLVSPQT